MMHRPRTIDPLRLGLLRLAFAIGGRFAPQHTVNRAGRLFATPHASSRSRARVANTSSEIRRDEIRVASHTIATYVWGDPVNQPYALLVHGWSSFALRFLPWVVPLRAAGLAVVTFDHRATATAPANCVRYRTSSTPFAR